MKGPLLFVMMLCIHAEVCAQFMEDSNFQIYRTWEAGAIIELRVDSSKAYETKVIEFYCSLCEHDSLRTLFNTTGTWSLINDTIILIDSKLGDSLALITEETGVLRTTDRLDPRRRNLPMKFYDVSDERKLEMTTNEFVLVYDTYPNGMCKEIFDRGRLRSSEYRIRLDERGRIISLERNKKGKLKKVK